MGILARGHPSCPCVVPVVPSSSSIASTNKGVENVENVDNVDNADQRGQNKGEIWGFVGWRLENKYDRHDRPSHDNRLIHEPYHEP